MTTAPVSILAVHGVGMTFEGAGGRHAALDDISFDIDARDLVAIVGESGCGKTTLLRIMAGLQRPTTGEVRLAGVPIVRPEPQVCLVFQHYAATLLPWRDALDNVLFDNLERGLSIEDMDHVSVRGNRLVNNATSQLMILQSEYDSESNCFGSGSPDQWAADFYVVDHYKTLAEYQEAKHQDLHSRAGGCGPLPAKVDVRKLHAETMSYAERARKTLRDAAKAREPKTTTTE